MEPTSVTPADGAKWWQTAVVYQIYPRSFADGDGNGVGDLVGIRDRLDHLHWLGVDAIWLSPVFRSPMADFGYDVSDYCDIDPTFGTLADMDALVADCHALGIRVMLDWVPNHTSDQHPWFEESRRDRTNAKADWYVWRDEPMNNWLAAFPPGETAWQLDSGRNQYYLRCFLQEQPDLNWDQPAVEAAMQDTLRFWLDRGIDGFRMDVVHLLGKQLDQDDPADEVAKGHSHVPFNDVPVTHERIRGIRRVLDSYPGDRTSVGEVYLLDEAKMAAYYGNGDELHMSFNFSFLWTAWNAAALRRKITRTLGILEPIGAWPTWVLSNHDVVRHRQRLGGVGPDSDAVARIAAVMLLTLRGTPFVYQGEELGLLDAVVPDDRVVDPGGRDGCRAPIPWSDDPDRGWGPDPWLPFPPEADARNVAAQRADSGSILHVYRSLLQLRRAHPALQTGELVMHDRSDDAVVYERSLGGQRYVVALNLGDSPAAVAELAGTHLLLSTTPRDEVAGEEPMVGAASAVVAVAPMHTVGTG